MNSNMIEHVDIIDALADQMTVMLDLMHCTTDNVDIKSIQLASEMLLGMLDDIVMEIHEMKMDCEVQE